MKPTRRRTRSVGAAVTAVLCLAIWQPAPVASQGADRVAEATRALDGGRVDEAIAVLEKAVAADPNDPAALAWLGSAQVRKARDASMFAAAGWVNTGFQTMDQAVERFPDAFIVYVVRGITATRVPDFFGKLPLAIGDLRTVVTMKETNSASVPDAAMPSVYLHLGHAYKKTNQLGEARSAWEKGKSAYPAAPEARAIDEELQRL
jgi:tetratricopeptide (TPR) repeat protein